MADTARPEPNTAPTGSVRKKTGRGVLWGVLAMVIAFGAGFLWQYFEATTVRGQLEAVEQELAVERFRVRLGQATLAAQAGDFEAARQEMSSLFNSLQEQVAMLPPEIEQVARDFLARRDDIITGLSRSNPAFADVLSGMLERLGTVIERTGTGPAPVAPAPTEGEPVEEPTSPQTGDTMPEPGQSP
jgi:hypothetical protein